MFVARGASIIAKLEVPKSESQLTIQAQPKEGHVLLSCANVHVASLSIGRFIMTSNALELCQMQVEKLVTLQQRAIFGIPWG
jgi:hypothetical protein